MVSRGRRFFDKKAKKDYYKLGVCGGNNEEKMMDLFKRSAYCGQIGEKFAGKEIFLSGWVDGRRDLGGLIFIDLRDRTGVMQLVFNPEVNVHVAEQAGCLRNEFVISVRGKVVEREAGQVNDAIPTGKYELSVLDVSIVSESKTPPFEIEDATNASEDLRLKYRYLDLRRPKMQRYMKLRHDVSFAIREYLNKCDFYEIETPILSKSTPEGARDFLVPSRLQKGLFYALPQSPQLYKQLLMAAGMERYFQIARCFRDEDLRANRQPEFTQLDLEMSFVSMKDVQDVTEGLVNAAWENVHGKSLELPFPRIKYAEAIARFGSDAPDLRFGLEIQDITDLFTQTNVKFLESVIKTGGKIGALHVRGVSFSRSQLSSWEDRAKKHFGAQGLLWVSFGEDGSCSSPISKLLPEDFFAQVRDLIPTIAPGDTLFIIADEYLQAWTALGRLRVALGEKLGLIDMTKMSFVWVTDFPLLEWSFEDERWYAKHHPFTLPQKGFETQEPGEMKAYAYDLVCNGVEIGGGSLRVYDPETQQKVFGLLGISEQEARAKFGFLLDAQEYGFPPHGGIALGLDRFVMLVVGTESMRDVIAFPKTSSGSCLMMESPSEVSNEQLNELDLL